MHRTLTTGSSLIAALMAADRLAGRAVRQHAGSASAEPPRDRHPANNSARPPGSKPVLVVEEAARKPPGSF
jgi:hypothetical protein